MNGAGTNGPREGFTTGSAVAAAASAALAVLLTGESARSAVIPPPPDENGAVPDARLTVPVARCERVATGGMDAGYAEVVKDGGDDPDATSGMPLTVTVAREPFAGAASLIRLTDAITVYAGEGIGLVTLPGLPVAVGEMALNPAPRRQLAAALSEKAAMLGYGGPIHCLIAAPEGAIRARDTLNGRLGITGGISILGTTGTVKAFSAEAWKTTITRSLDLALAQGDSGARTRSVAFSTGRRSEAALRARLPVFAPHAFIQVADHAGFAAREAAERGFTEIVFGCFPGKLLKLAQGLAWTHARAAAPDFSLLRTLCAQALVPDSAMTAAMALPTALGALAVIHDHSPRKHAAVILAMARRAAAAVSAMASTDGNGPSVRVYAFDMRGRLLAKGHAWKNSAP